MNVAKHFTSRRKRQAGELKRILLYASNIPFEINISGALNLKAIISMIPGQATHWIDKISSNVHEVKDILDCFSRMPYSSSKTVSIKEIQGKDQLIKNVIIKYEPKKDLFVFYDLNNKTMLAKYPYEAVSGGVRLFRTAEISEFNQDVYEGAVFVEELYYFAKNGDIEKLSGNKNNIDVGNEKGDTALMRSVRESDAHAVKNLLEAGADVNAQKKDGKTALDIARENKNLEVVKIIEDFIMQSLDKEGGEDS